MNIARLAIPIVVLSISGAALADSRQECRQSPKLVAPCYSVRGRFYAANGTPSLRIWRIGTSRILGVVDWDGEAEGRTIATPWLMRTMVGRGFAFATRIYGDFEVCPLTRERPGWMQMVCIARVSRVVATSNQDTTLGPGPVLAATHGSDNSWIHPPRPRAQYSLHVIKAVNFPHICRGYPGCDHATGPHRSTCAQR